MNRLEQILADIDFALQLRETMRSRSQYSDFSDLGKAELAELVTTLAATIDRHTSVSDPYAKQAGMILKQHSPHHDHIAHQKLYGVLKSLRQAYERGYLITVQELIHRDVFSDFLDMADHLLTQGYKDPAAVIIGGTLEEHLRKLCGKHEIPTTTQDGRSRKASQMNDDLVKAGSYDKLQQKGVTFWLDLRNNAAHGKYDNYDTQNVRTMLVGVQDFISKFRA